MTYQRRINPVLRSLSRPLTILGAERKLFFFAMCLGAATFNLLGSLTGGVLMFCLLYLVARWATRTDPQILRFLLTAARLRAQYDPMKFTPVEVRRDAHAQAYDGTNPLPPMFCYLKPYYNDVNKSYFRQLADGEL